MRTEEHAMKRVHRALDALAAAIGTTPDADRFRQNRDALFSSIARRAPNSAYNYSCTLWRWATWAAQNPGNPLDLEALQRYVSSTNQTFATSSLMSMSQAVRFTLKGLGCLTEERVALLQANYRLAYRTFNAAPSAEPPLPKDFLLRLESTCDLKNLRDLCDLAVTTLIAETLMTPNEFLGPSLGLGWGAKPLDASDISRRFDGTARMPRCSASSSDSPREVFVSRRAMRAMDLWLDRAGISHGAVFRRVPDPFAATAAFNEPLGSQYMTDLLRRVAARTGVPRAAVTSKQL